MADLIRKLWPHGGTEINISFIVIIIIVITCKCETQIKTNVLSEVRQVTDQSKTTARKIILFHNANENVKLIAIIF